MFTGTNGDIISKESSGIKVYMGETTNTGGMNNYSEDAVRTISDELIREKIGIVSQDAILFSGTIRYNITMGKNYPEEQVRAAAKLSLLILRPYFLEIFGLKYWE